MRATSPYAFSASNESFFYSNSCPTPETDTVVFYIQVFNTYVVNSKSSIAMAYLDKLAKANEIGGIVIKTRYNRFEVCNSFWSFSLLIIRQPFDQCYYEIISNRQCTYVDLDLKIEECASLPPEIAINHWSMAGSRGGLL